MYSSNIRLLSILFTRDENILHYLILILLKATSKAAPVFRFFQHISLLSSVFNFICLVYKITP